MDKRLKEALVEACRAPAPERKAAFLKQHRRRELGRWELAAVQAGYIRRWVWGLSLGVFGAILWAAARPYAAGLLCAAALTPFLALLAVAESGRARFYQMEELELACRMSRASVLLARMLALGLFHLVLLGALAMQGITPGPAVFERQPVLMYTIMLAMFVINIFMFLQGRLFIKAFVNVVKIPAALLNAIIVAMCTIGAYSVNNSVFDVFVMVVFAAIGYLMNRVDMPTTPLLMGVILGTMAESNLRRVLAMSNGSWLPLFTKPISCIILVLSILLVLVPLGSKAIHKLLPAKDQEAAQ